MADPDIWQAPIQEAIASARGSYTVIETLEIIHPLFLEDGTAGAIRIAINQRRNWSLRVPVDAPAKPGQVCTYYGAAVRFTQPETSAGSIQGVAEIEVDNVKRDLLPTIRLFGTIRATAEIIYRMWISTDTSKPRHTMPGLIMSSIGVNQTTIKGRATFRNGLGQQFPIATFDRDGYIGLFTAG